MNKLIKTALPIICFVLCFVYFSPNVYAETTGVTVYVRVESGAADKEGTLLPRTAVTVEATDMTTYGAPANTDYPTALQALLQEAGDELSFSYSEYGAYITSLFGLSDDGRMSWLYAVNNELPEVGASEYELHDNDEVVFYYLDWQAGSYAYFTPAETTVQSGQPFNLTLTGNHFTDGLFPVANAELLITAPEGVPMPRNIHYTDEEGNVRLAFYAPGTYEIAARKANEDGVYIISRAYSAVTVEESDVEWETELGDAELLEETNDLKVEVETAGETGEEPESLKLEPSEDYKDTTFKIALIINMEEGRIYLYGQPVETELVPVYQGETVMIPFRAVAESLGATVGWDAPTETVTARYEDKQVAFTLQDTLNGVPVMVIEGRTYVPTNYFIEQFELKSVVE